MQKLLKTVPWRPLLLFVMAVVAYVVEWIFYAHEVIGLRPGGLHWLLYTMADAAVLYLLYWVVPARFRWTILIPVWALSLFMWANLVYLRQFDDLIPFSNLVYFYNFNGLLFNSAWPLMRLRDLVFMLTPLAATVVYFVCFRGRVSKPEFNKWLKITMVCGSLLLFLCAQIAYSVAEKRHWDSINLKRSWSGVLSARYLDYLSPRGDLRANGFTVYILKNIYVEVSKASQIKSYKPEQLAAIDDYLAANAALPVADLAPFAGNERKNLIFIIVESLNADVIHRRIDGVEVTPVLNRLVETGGTISALKVISQVSVGGSSDGQMLYNTGLLPLRHTPTVLAYDNLVYPSLASALPEHYAFEVICEQPRFWNHTETNRLWGFKALYSEDDLNASPYNPAEIGSDMALFSFAADLFTTLPQPFYAELTTLTMHLPFDRKVDVRLDAIENCTSIPSIEKRYLRVTHYFDSALGRFLDMLRERGLYDNSVIVIASDHNCRFTDDGYENGMDVLPGEIAFIALNTGLTRNIDEYVGQVDIFPTILDIMNHPHSAPSWNLASTHSALGESSIPAGSDDTVAPTLTGSDDTVAPTLAGSDDTVAPTLAGSEDSTVPYFPWWKGLGRSILAPGPKSAVDKNGRLYNYSDTTYAPMQRQAWEVSDLILRGNRFSNYKLR